MSATSPRPRAALAAAAVGPRAHDQPAEARTGRDPQFEAADRQPPERDRVDPVRAPSQDPAAVEVDRHRHDPPAPWLAQPEVEAPAIDAAAGAREAERVRGLRDAAGGGAAA